MAMAVPVLPWPPTQKTSNRSAVDFLHPRLPFQQVSLSEDHFAHRYRSRNRVNLLGQWWSIPELDELSGGVLDRPENLEVGAVDYACLRKQAIADQRAKRRYFPCGRSGSRAIISLADDKCTGGPDSTEGSVDQRHRHDLGVVVGIERLFDQTSAFLDSTDLA